MPTSIRALDLEKFAIFLEEFKTGGTYYVRQDYLLPAVVVQFAQTFLQDRPIQSHVAVIDAGCRTFYC